MSKLKTFFYALRRTFTSPAYYADILKAPFGFSLKFFLTFFFIYSLVFSGWFTVRYLLPLGDLLEFLPLRLIEIYPAELEVTIKNGQLSTNVPEPYKISKEELEEVFKDVRERVLGADSESIENLVVIDTAGKVDDFASYKTYLLVTGNSLAYINDQGNMEVVSLAEVSNLKVNRQTVENVIGMVSPYLRYVMPLLAVLIFLVGFVFYSLTRLTYLLFLALILLLVGKIVKYPLSYMKSYQMGLHLVVVSTTLFSLLALARITVLIPFAQTILLVALGLAILLKLKPLPVASEKTKTKAKT